jgi:hypothetical protein
MLRLVEEREAGEERGRGNFLHMNKQRPSHAQKTRNVFAGKTNRKKRKGKT